jgi:hypothetical protein
VARRHARTVARRRTLSLARELLTRSGSAVRVARAQKIFK